MTTRLRCDDIDMLVDEYITSALDDETRALFEAHVENCAVCRKRVQTATHSVELVREALGWVTPSEDFERRVSTHLRLAVPVRKAAQEPLLEEPESDEKKRLRLLGLTALLVIAAAFALLWALLRFA